MKSNWSRVFGEGESGQLQRVAESAVLPQPDLFFHPQVDEVEVAHLAVDEPKGDPHAGGRGLNTRRPWVFECGGLG